MYRHLPADVHLQEHYINYWLLVPLLAECGRCPPEYGNNDVNFLTQAVGTAHETDIVPDDPSSLTWPEVLCATHLGLHNNNYS
jgi:hypothetical protein